MGREYYKLDESLMALEEKSKIFFIVVPPQFERLALYELQGALAAFDFSLTDYEIHAGGIELTLPFDLGLALNRVLKIPTRILMRITTKDILSFQDFEKFIKSLNWKHFGPLRDVYVSSRSSKMKMKEAIKKSFLKTIPFKSQKNGTDVYIRMFRDQCTLSVDTSGDDLFHRGQEKWVGEAPIRDNMAAGLLQLALQGTDGGEGWEIVDPMMGAGTFLTEAVTASHVAQRPFCFENWTGDYQPPTLKIASQKKDIQILGRDKELKNIDIAKKNLRQVGLPHANLDLDDLFSDQKGTHTSRPRLVILNPPYGKRLAVKDKSFFQKTVDAIDSKYSPQRLALIVPRGADFQPLHYERMRHMPFSNNGIDVEFYLFVRK